MSQELTRYLKQMPLVAILRGINPDEVLAVVDLLENAGICIVEVPLNSPEPYRSIKKLAGEFGERLLIGAGTVISVEQARAVKAAGGGLIMSPNMNPEVIIETKKMGMVSAPGVATLSEAFASISAGADALKAFPAEMLKPDVIASWRSVLPRDIPLLPVGGIDVNNMKAYWTAGANGFGLGGSLYKAGKQLDEINQSAKQIVAMVDLLRYPT